MVKKLLLSLALFCLPVLLYAGKSSDWLVVIASANVSGTATIYSTPVCITDYEAFGYEFIVHGSTHQLSDVSFAYQVCAHDESTITTTEISADVWTTPTTGGTIDSQIVDGGSHADAYQVDAFSPMATRWLRFAVTGNSGNDPLTYVTVRISGYGIK